MADPILELVPMGRPLLEALIGDARERAHKLAAFRLPEGFSKEAIELFAFRLNQLIATPEAEPWLLRALVTREGRQMVGYANFHGPPGINDAAHPTAVSIGYTVFPAHRGQGYATRAARELLEWAHRERGVTHVVCGVRPDNTASIRVLEKLGFERTGLVVDDEVIFERGAPAQQ